MEVVDHLKEFSDRLKELIVINNESAKTLSEKTAIRCSTLYAYMSGKRIPFLPNALIIANYFQCSLDFLFGFSDDYTKKHRTVCATVHERFKTALDDSGKSHYRLAKETHINQSDISAWYLGKRPPSLITLVAFAKVLDCSLDFLAGIE